MDGKEVAPSIFRTIIALLLPGINEISIRAPDRHVLDGRLLVRGIRFVRCLAMAVCASGGRTPRRLLANNARYP